MAGEGCRKEHQAALLPKSDQPNAGMLCSVHADSYLHPVGFAESGIKKRTFLIFGRLQKNGQFFMPVAGLRSLSPHIWCLFLHFLNRGEPCNLLRQHNPVEMTVCWSWAQTPRGLTHFHTFSCDLVQIIYELAQASPMEDGRTWNRDESYSWDLLIPACLKWPSKQPQMHQWTQLRPKGPPSSSAITGSITKLLNCELNERSHCFKPLNFGVIRYAVKS